MRALLIAVLLLIASMGSPVAIFRIGTTANEPQKAETITIEHGTATFVVPTNMPGITVKGKSEALQARVEMRLTPEGITLEHIQAWLPVKTIATGIAVRDEHMRHYVFATPSGEIPDVRFAGENVFCPGISTGREATCKISGILSIRGVPRNFSMLLKVRETGAAPVFQGAGDGLVKLSDYAIEAPTQFGVKTANEIQVHIELPEATAVAGTRGRQ